MASLSRLMKMIALLSLLGAWVCVPFAQGQQAERPLPYFNAKMVYVSPTGDNANSGSSADEAVQTVEQGLSLLRAGQADWLLLERGHEYEITQEVEQPSGASPLIPMVIIAYGEGTAPKLNVGPNNERFSQDSQATHHILAYDVVMTGLDIPFPTELDTTLQVFDDLADSAFFGWPLLIEGPGAARVTLRDVWSRPGRENVVSGELAGDLADAFRIYRADGVRLENISASGSTDECIEIAESRGVTLYRALISDPIDEPGIHPKGTPHGHGLIVVGQKHQDTWEHWAPVVVQECLFANCGGRSPTLLSCYPTQGALIGELRAQVINTVSYNPTRFALKLGSTVPENQIGNIIRADIVGNLIIVGPNTDVAKLQRTLQAGQWEHVYAKDNWIQQSDGTRHDLFEWAGVTPGRDEPNFDLPAYLDSPDEVLANVLDYAGARPRDAHDTRVVREINEAVGN